MTASTNGGNVTVVVENVRFSYCNVHQPLIGVNAKTGKPTRNFCVHGIMAPNHPAIAKIKEAQRTAAAFMWKDKAADMLLALAGQDKLALHDGNVSKPGSDGYAGNFFISCNSPVKPKIVATLGGVNVEIPEDHPYAPYSGCFGSLIVDIWPMQNDFGKRINAQVTGVQFLRHGDRFGGGRVARMDEFGIAPADADGAVPGGAPADTSVSSLV